MGSENNDGIDKTTAMTTTSKPSDGPATAFIPDPVVPDMISKSTGYYGIVINAMWPPPSDTLTKPYDEQFLPLVRKCFDEADVSPGGDSSNNSNINNNNNNNSDNSACYFYPSQYLHVTVATLTPIIKRDQQEQRHLHHHDELAYYETLKQTWIPIFDRASQRADWPTASSLQFEIDSAQIGRKAGILLWKETTGALQQIRECLAVQVAEEDGVEIHNTPNIMHSTFLRFQSVPSTEGALVQERFASQVAPKLHDIFSKPIQASWIKMACEWTPYMHIPDDDHHVFRTVHLGEKSNQKAG